jgi:hypothetical protein
MVTREQFMAPILPFVNVGIYVWGTAGDVVLSESWIRMNETSEANALRAIKLWKARLAAGIRPVISFDCSGLGVYALRYHKLSTIRYSSRGFRRISQLTTDPKVGDFAIKAYDGGAGDAYHIGYISRPGYVIEAKGRDDGVVETALKGWTEYRTNPFIKEADMLKRGDKGDAVVAWQRRLIQWNANALPRFKADGDFGAETETWTNTFLKSVGLPENGTVTDIAWDRMITVLMSSAVPPSDVLEELSLLRNENAYLREELHDTQKVKQEYKDDLLSVSESLRLLETIRHKH